MSYFNKMVFKIIFMIIFKYFDMLSLYLMEFGLFNLNISKDFDEYA